MMIVLTTCECDSVKRARRVREAGGCVSVHEHVWERLNLELAEEQLHPRNFRRFMATPPRGRTLYTIGAVRTARFENSISHYLT
jgi:hypothetical protein